VQNPAACAGETWALELVPWSCAFDDASQTATCVPASLQLTKTAGECQASLPRTSLVKCSSRLLCKDIHLRHANMPRMMPC
jgi:hypothetical protein